MSAVDPAALARRKPRPFRRAVWRGIAVILPPLLTVVIFLWVGNTVSQYVLEPVTAGVRDVIAWQIADVRKLEDLPDSTELAGGVYQIEGERFKRLLNDDLVPEPVYDVVRDHVPTGPMPQTAAELYQSYVESRYLQPFIVIPLFLAVFIVLMYLLGRFLAAGIGRVLWNLFERGILQLPVVRNVYSSVKQVTDFIFTEQEIEYTRVVAVEYPRKGIWSIGLATGDGMIDVKDAAGEDIVSVLIPSSPMPVTGYTITIRKSEVVDLDITIDQAFQFVISCGVVVPPHQMPAPFGGSAELPAEPSGDRNEGAAGSAAVSTARRD